MTTVTNKSVTVTKPGAADPPIDVGAITHIVSETLDMSLSTTTWDEIRSRTRALTGHLALLGDRCQVDGEDEAVARLLGLVASHLSLDKRPTGRSHAHDAFGYMHDTAVFARALLALYARQQGSSAP
ncbi:hypothetical protein GPA10_22525 [Streptomyces sp. p1417]|uniref:Uncharacterized protein n=1 Tax=Streptomyces typhae TaxID=2681492 RepID=A0A6L6X0Z1_9ACTN|nr:hypothetical protein [Streptomyces typhae]MVO87462.1 hypothetical protein [Streptomyces typhae]